MNTRLIYSDMVTGHNMEYLHHLYLGALEDRSHIYVFAVPREFEDKKDLMEWKANDRIHFRYLDEYKASNRNLLLGAWYNSRLLGKVAKDTKAKEIFLVSLIDFIPFLPLFVPKGVRVAGIIYKIYLYFLEEMSWSQKIQEWLKYKVMTSSHCLKRVLILNDQESADELNRRWNTHKYRFLPDPFIPFAMGGVRDMREEMGVGKDKTIVLHIGSITHGKGSDRIFDMIDNSNSEELKDYCFVFAGVIAQSIKEEFYRRLGICREKANIIVKDQFLNYFDLGSLVYTADKVVLPYRRIGQSSGIIAYCAQMGTPVYVPSKGLIGRLVSQFSIGACLDDFHDIHSIEVEAKAESLYCESHTIGSFYRTILKT